MGVGNNFIIFRGRGMSQSVGLIFGIVTPNDDVVSVANLVVCPHSESNCCIESNWCTLRPGCPIEGVV